MPKKNLARYSQWLQEIFIQCYIVVPVNWDKLDQVTQVTMLSKMLVESIARYETRYQERVEGRRYSKMMYRPRVVSPRSSTSLRGKPQATKRAAMFDFPKAPSRNMSVMNNEI